MSWHFQLRTDLSAFSRKGWQSLVTLIADVRGKHWSLSLSLLSCFFLSLSPQFYEWKGMFHQTKLLDGFQLHWFLFDLSWEQPYGRRLESWGGWIERGSPVDIYRSRGGNYPGTDANCVYNYWHLCKWAALAIRREVYHNLSRCFVLRFSDWRGCWEIGTFCHLNHGLPCVVKVQGSFYSG